MDAYEKALHWAAQRGDSGGAIRVRQLLLSLYDPETFAYSAGSVLAGVDEDGAALVLACLSAYAELGETQGLRRVGAAILKRGDLQGFVELCDAAQEARDTVRRRWSNGE